MNPVSLHQPGFAGSTASHRRPVTVRFAADAPNPPRPALDGSMSSRLARTRVGRLLRWAYAQLRLTKPQQDVERLKLDIGRLEQSVAGLAHKRFKRLEGLAKTLSQKELRHEKRREEIDAKTKELADLEAQLESFGGGWGGDYQTTGPQDDFEWEDPDDTGDTWKAGGVEAEPQPWETPDNEYARMEAEADKAEAQSRENLKHQIDMLQNDIRFKTKFLESETRALKALYVEYEQTTEGFDKQMAVLRMQLRNQKAALDKLQGTSTDTAPKKAG